MILSLDVDYRAVIKAGASFAHIPDPAGVGDAVRREYVCIQYPVMGVHQVKIHAPDFPFHEPGKNQRPHKTRKNNFRYFMKGDPIRTGDPAIRKDMYFEIFVSRETLGNFTGEAFSAADQSIFGYDYSDLPASSVIQLQ